MRPVIKAWALRRREVEKGEGYRIQSREAGQAIREEGRFKGGLGSVGRYHRDLRAELRATGETGSLAPALVVAEKEAILGGNVMKLLRISS